MGPEIPRFHVSNVKSGIEIIEHFFIFLGVDDDFESLVKKLIMQGFGVFLHFVQVTKQGLLEQQRHLLALEHFSDAAFHSLK